MNNKVYCVISHTHWDREWYMPLERFRLKLVDLLDRCLELLEEQPDYIFHLDAQTIVLEDYLSIRTSARPRLERAVKSGQLIIGPWYLQNDLYLASGESTVRNLIEGRRVAGEFGKCSSDGYVPDQFGLISQLPGILSEFGVDNVIFGRGLYSKLDETTSKPSEFIWRGADGTEALAINMRFWYNNAQRFSADIEKARILLETSERLFDGIAVTPYLLLMNGVDHLEAQDDLLPILARLQEKGYQVSQYTFEKYLREVREYIDDNAAELFIHEGELRQGRDGSILKGTLSSRVYLKTANVKAQTLLENVLEPLYSMLTLRGMKNIYSLDHFRYIWKELLKNHPHDSICGCSCDEVHAHMEDNYARLFTTMSDMLERGMNAAAVHLNTAGANDKNYIIAAANTTQRVLSQVVDVTVDIPKYEKSAGFTITDNQGNTPEFVVLSKSDALRDGFSPLNLPGVFPVDRYKIQLLARDIAPFSVAGFVVNLSDAANELCSAVCCEGAGAENEYLKVAVSGSGCVEITDKKTGRVITDAFDFEDTSDRGDSYVYWPDPAAPVIYWSEFAPEINITHKNSLRTEIEITREMILPAEYIFNEGRPSAETVKCPVTLILGLSAASQHLEVGYRVNNRACDHRLRLIVRTGIQAGETVADIPFDIVSHTPADHFAETASKTLPNSTFAALQNEKYGTAVFTCGEHDYEHITADSGISEILAFTVVRSTGVINRNRSGSFEPGGGSQWDAPANQCLRELSGRVAVYPYSGSGETAYLPELAVQFRAGLIVYYTSYDETRFMQGRTAVQDSRLEEYFFYPDPYKNVAVEDNISVLSAEGALVTALKRAEDGEGIVLRMVNLSEESAEINISAGERRIIRSGLDERPGEELGVNINQNVGSKKICSFRIMD